MRRKRRRWKQETGMRRWNRIEKEDGERMRMR